MRWAGKGSGAGAGLAGHQGGGSGGEGRELREGGRTRPRRGRGELCVVGGKGYLYHNTYSRKLWRQAVRTMDEYKVLSSTEVGEVGVRLAGHGQEVWFAWEGWSRLLALTLARDLEWRREVAGEREFVVVRHDRELDDGVVELIDLLIDIRYSHPTMVQLQLALGEEERQELAEAVGG